MHFEIKKIKGLDITLQHLTKTSHKMLCFYPFGTGHTAPCGLYFDFLLNQF